MRCHTQGSKKKINEIPAVLFEMSFNARSLVCPHEIPHILYIPKRGTPFHHSRSSTVNNIGGNWKHICNFLLVRNSNLGPILHRFGAMARFMCSRPPPLFRTNFGAFPLHQIAHVGVSERMGPYAIWPWNYFGRFPTYVITTRKHRKQDRRTDGRTDGQTTCNRITALCAGTAR